MLAAVGLNTDVVKPTETGENQYMPSTQEDFKAFMIRQYQIMDHGGYYN